MRVIPQIKPLTRQPLSAGSIPAAASKSYFHSGKARREDHASASDWIVAAGNRALVHTIT
jgi:hypothetical protein